jgi:hypothetical protein
LTAKTGNYKDAGLSWLVIVPLLISLFSIAVIIRHRKTANLTRQTFHQQAGQKLKLKQPLFDYSIEKQAVKDEHIKERRKRKTSL